MRWPSFILVALAFALATDEPGRAQIIRPAPSVVRPQPLTEIERVDLRTNAGPETLEIQTTAVGRMGPFSGSMIGGDTVFGARERQGATERWAFVRVRAGEPSVAYIAERQTGQRLTGVRYALRASAGARTNGNAWRFVSGASLRYARRADTSALPPTLRPYVFVTDRDTIRAGPEQWPAQLTFAATGEISGTLGGDALIGHYAQATGSLIVVRMRAGRPFQLFSAAASRDSSLAGTFYPLSEAGYLDEVPFEIAWTAIDTQTVVMALNSAESTECIAAPAPGASDPNRLVLKNCDGDPREGWAIIRTDTQASPTTWALLSMATGRCISNRTHLATCGENAAQRYSIRGHGADNNGAHHFNNALDRVSNGAASISNWTHLQFHAVTADLCIGVVADEANDGAGVIFGQQCPADQFWEPAWWGKRSWSPN